MRERFRVGILFVALLVGCSGIPKPTGTVDPSPTSPLAGNETAETATGEAGPVTQNEPLDAIREAVLERASEPDRVNATLYQHLTTTVLGGESVIFHWEDTYSGVVVGCSGHAVTALDSAGWYKVATISAECGPTDVQTPITMFPSQGIDTAGETVAVVYGEIYSQDVAAIRVAYDGGEVEALIVGGGWYSELPLGATGIMVRAYDAAGGVLQEGAPPPP